MARRWSLSPSLPGDAEYPADLKIIKSVGREAVTPKSRSGPLHI